jgi:large subunit ribosomal protein L10
MPLSSGRPDLMVTVEKLGKLCKEKMITELLLRFEKHPNFIVTSFGTSSTAELESLRGDLKKASANYFVVKNSILKIAFSRLKVEESAFPIDGGIGISFTGDDAVSACNVLVGFSKRNEKFKIRGGVIEGRRVAPEKIKMLAAIPPRNILLAQVVGGIKSPITGFVNVMGGILRKFVYVMDAIKRSKEKTKET